MYVCMCCVCVRGGVAAIYILLYYIASYIYIYIYIHTYTHTHTHAKLTPVKVSSS